MSDTKHERPEGWPAQFTAPRKDCHHDYRWDRATGDYVCRYCLDRKDEPPIKYHFPVGRKVDEVDTGTIQCPDCGFSDRSENFDKMGMDLMCPSCGKIGVRD